MNKQEGSNQKQRSGALHLTQKVDYGLMLLIHLSKTKKTDSISIKKIAEEKDLSFSFLQKIARILLKSNIIEAQRGKYGGYKLGKDPTKINLAEIIEILEGPIAIVPCLKPSCTPTCWKRNKKCEVKSGLEKINKEIERFFKEKTLAQIIS
jgi:Rrf2 family cysteine metabolism transcriptional repressor